MRQASKLDLTHYRQARRGHDVAVGDICFHSWLEGPDGSGFCLFREAHHTDADIERAKQYIVKGHDVTGAIEVCDIATMLAEDELKRVQ